LENLPTNDGTSELFVVYQLGFAATTVTIVSGAIAGRAGFAAYVTLCIAVSVITYPLFGHWAWGNLMLTDNRPWLVDLGFVDFAGSTVVHSVGGWVGLIAAWIIGPRLGRFGDDEQSEFTSHSYALAVLGVLVLWFGWFGFNGGSVGDQRSLIGPVILNTCLAGSAAGLSGYAHAVMLQGRKRVPAKLLGAPLTGLVAITACCHVVTPSLAVLAGAVAGVLHNLAYEALIKLRIDDAVGVFPVHAIGGMWGTLCVGLLGSTELLALPRTAQIGVQALGIAVCAVWSLGTAWLFLVVIRATLGLRVSPEEEIAGVSVAGEQEPPPRAPALTERELLQLMGEDG